MWNGNLAFLSADISFCLGWLSSGNLFRGCTKSIVIQISIALLIFLLFYGAEVSRGANCFTGVTPRG